MKRLISKLLVISFISQTAALPVYAEDTGGTTNGLYGITNITSGTGTTGLTGGFGTTGLTGGFGTTGLTGGFGTTGLTGGFGTTGSTGGFGTTGSISGFGTTDFSFSLKEYNPYNLNFNNPQNGSTSNLGFSGFNPTSSLDGASRFGSSSSGSLSYTASPGFDPNSSFLTPENVLQNKTPREKFMEKISGADNTVYITPVSEFDLQLDLFNTQNNPYFNVSPTLELGGNAYVRNQLKLYEQNFRNDCRDLYVDIMLLDHAEESAVTCSGKTVRETVSDIEDTLRQINYYENLVKNLKESSQDNEVGLLELTGIINDLKEARENSGYKDPVADDEINPLGREKYYLDEIGLGNMDDNSTFFNLETLSKNNFRAIEAKIEVIKAKAASLEQNINDYADSPVHKNYETIKASLVKNFERRGCVEEFQKANSPLTDDWKMRDLQNSVCHQKSVDNIYGTELPELVTVVNNILKKLDYAAAEDFEENLEEASENASEDNAIADLETNYEEVSKFIDACKSAVTLSPYIIYSCEEMFRDDVGFRKEGIEDTFKKYEPLQCGENTVALYNTEVNGEKQFASTSLLNQRRREEQKLFEAFDSKTQDLTSEELALISLTDDHLQLLVDNGRIDNGGNDNNGGTDDLGGNGREDKVAENDDGNPEDNNGGTDDLGGNGREDKVAENDDGNPEDNNGDTGDTGATGDDGGRGNENPVIVDPARFIASFDNVRGVESQDSCASSERYVQIGNRHACVLKCNRFQTPTGAENGYQCKTNHVSVNSYNSSYDERKKSQARGYLWKGGVAGVGGAIAMVGIVSWASRRGRDKGRTQMTDMFNSGANTAQSPTPFSAPRGTFGAYSPITRYSGQSYSSSLSDGLFNFNNTGLMFDPSNPMMNGSYGGAIGGSYGFGGIGSPYTGGFNGYSFP